MGISIHKMEGESFEVRVGDIHEGYGTPYVLGLVAKVVDKHSVEFRLLSSKISKSEMREIRESFEEMGFTNLVWDRKSNGTTTQKGLINTRSISGAIFKGNNMEDFRSKLVKAEDAVVTLNSLTGLAGAYDLDVAAEKQVSYDEGFSAGKLSMGEPDDKIYSQAEVDSMVQPLQQSLADSQAALAELQANVETQVSSAIADLKASLLAAYESAQAEETSSEEAIRNLLK